MLKKICFAILVHEKREIIQDMIDNIHYFCPNSSIVLYNGGADRRLCEGLDVPVCPYSKKLDYGLTAIYLFEVMQWLQEINYPYDYLVNVDSDALFAQKGYEAFLEDQMKDKDYLAVHAGYRDDSWVNGKCIRMEWEKWRPIFQKDEFANYGVFNVGQTFSRELVNRILTFEDFDVFIRRLRRSTAWGSDEVIPVNLVRRLGFKVHSYPKDPQINPHQFDWHYGLSIRYRPFYTKEEVCQYLNDPIHANSYLFHPVHRDMNDQARNYIRGLIKREEE